MYGLNHLCLDYLRIDEIKCFFYHLHFLIKKIPRYAIPRDITSMFGPFLSPGVQEFTFTSQKKVTSRMEKVVDFMIDLLNQTGL